MKYAYPVFTALLMLPLLGGGVYDTLSPPEIVEQVKALGFPEWFPRWLGVWKLLGAAVILAPGLPRLKEWAYAGLLVNLTSAAAAHAFHGDTVGNVVTPIVVLGFALGSWATRPASRRLGEVLPIKQAA